MITVDLTRRQFLGTLTAAGAATAVEAAEGDPRRTGWSGTDRVEKIPTICEMCFWRCGVLASVKDGVVVKLEGNPAPSADARQAVRQGQRWRRSPVRPRPAQVPHASRGRTRGRAIQAHQLGRGARPVRLEVEGHQGRARRGERRVLPARAQPEVLRHADERVRHAEQRRAVVRAVPRAAGSRLWPDLRPGAGLAGAARPGILETHRAHRQSSRRERLHLADHRVRDSARRGARSSSRSIRGSRPRQRRPTGGSRSGRAPTSRCCWRGCTSSSARDSTTGTTSARGPTDSTSSPTTCGRSRPSGPRRSRICPAEKIRETARAMGAAKPAVLVHPGRHVTWYGDDTQRARAMAILTALARELGTPRAASCCPRTCREAASTCRHFRTLHEGARMARARATRWPRRKWASPTAWWTPRSPAIPIRSRRGSSTARTSSRASRGRS